MQCPIIFQQIEKFGSYGFYRLMQCNISDKKDVKTPQNGINHYLRFSYQISTYSSTKINKDIQKSRGL